MGLIILATILSVPVVEIAVFIEAGNRVGVWPTVGGVILTAIIGTALFRHQGLGLIARARSSLEAGQMPLREVVDGLGLLIAGLLLLIPGFVTDVLGFLLFVPPIRILAVAGLIKRVMRSGQAHVHMSADTGGFNAHQPNNSSGPIIDGDFVDLGEPERGTLVHKEDGQSPENQNDQQPRKPE